MSHTFLPSLLQSLSQEQVFVQPSEARPLLKPQNFADVCPRPRSTAEIGFSSDVVPECVRAGVC